MDTAEVMNIEVTGPEEERDLLGKTEDGVEDEAKIFRRGSGTVIRINCAASKEREKQIILDVC